MIAGGGVTVAQNRAVQAEIGLATERIRCARAETRRAWAIVESAQEHIRELEQQIEEIKDW